MKQWHLDWDMVESLDESSETNQSAETAEGNPDDTKEDNSSGPSKGDNSVSEENKSSVAEPETDGAKSNDKNDSDNGEKTEKDNEETLPNGPEYPGDEKDQNQGEKDKNLTQENGTSAVNGALSVNGEAGPSSVPDIPEPVRIEGPLFPVPSMTSVVSVEVFFIYF